MSSRFDGLEVDQHQARFAGTFDIDATDQHRMSLDTEIMFVAVARVGGATITETQTGDVRRTNKLDVRQVAVVRDKETQDSLYESLAHQLVLPDPQFDFGVPLQAPRPQPSNVSSDGELVIDVDEIDDLSMEVIVVTPAASTKPAVEIKDPVLSKFLVGGDD